VRGPPSDHGQTRVSAHTGRPAGDNSGGDGPLIPLAVAVLLFVAFLVLVAMWGVRRRAPAGAARGRADRVRIGIGIVGVIAVVVVARLLVAPLPSERTLTWKAGFAYDPAQTQATAVQVEVERPGCTPDGTSWLATPVVTYTPLAVFITVRMADTFNVPGCTGTLGYHDGRLPLVGGYLTGTYLDVQLTEPLRGRALFDGAGLLPEPRLPSP
jgi:hypothetical protein